jgi:predicted DNA-binding transcriptional regulator AlpA
MLSKEFVAALCEAHRTGDVERRNELVLVAMDVADAHNKVELASNPEDPEYRRFLEVQRRAFDEHRAALRKAKPRPTFARPRASARARRSPRTVRPQQSGDEGGGDDGSGPSPDDADPPDLGTEETARLLGVKPKTLYNKISGGTLPFPAYRNRATRALRFRRSEILAYLGSVVEQIEPRPTVSPVDDEALDRDRADRERRLSRLLDGDPEGGVQ